MSVGAMRMVVILRDGGCAARRIDPAAGPCYDPWGNPITNPFLHLEADYVRRGATGGRHEKASDHVALCPGHHRGTGPQAGYVWATAHREEMRRYLDGLPSFTIASSSTDDR